MHCSYPRNSARGASQEEEKEKRKEKIWTQTWTWNAQSKWSLNHFSSNTYDCIYQASNIFMLEASRLGFLRLTNPLNSTNLTQTISNGWVLIIDQNFPYHFLRSSMYHKLKSALCLLLTFIPHLIVTAILKCVVN